MEEKQNKLEVSIQNSLMLKKSMEIISDLVAEGTFIFKKDYLELVALTSNNVVMIIFRLLATNFSNYKIEKDEEIHLNLQNFNNIIKNCGDDSKLNVSVQDSTMKILVESHGSKDKEYELTLIDFQAEEQQKIPQLDLDLKLTMGSLEFSKAIKDLFFVEEKVEFNMDKDKFILHGKTNTMKAKVDLSEKIQIDTENNEKHISDYSIEYLKKFIKCDSIVKQVEINFKNGYPLKLDYKILDKLLLSFILAPRGND